MSKYFWLVLPIVAKIVQRVLVMVVRRLIVEAENKTLPERFKPYSEEIAEGLRFLLPILEGDFDIGPIQTPPPASPSIALATGTTTAAA